MQDSGLELTIPPKTHRRNRSDASCVSVMSYSGSEVVAADGNGEVISHLKYKPPHALQDPIVFVDSPPKNLLCMVCEKVFTDPVIAKCGVSQITPIPTIVRSIPFEYLFFSSQFVTNDPSIHFVGSVYSICLRVVSLIVPRVFPSYELYVL